MKPTVLKTVYETGDPRQPGVTTRLRGDGSERLAYGLYDESSAPSSATRLGTSGGRVSNDAEGKRPILGLSNPGFKEGWSPVTQAAETVERGRHYGGGKLGNAICMRGMDTLGSNLQVVTDGPTTVKFDLNAGGIIDSWAVNGAEVLNRGGGMTRGIQAGMHLPIYTNGRFLKHDPVQGGDLFSGGTDPLLRFAGKLLSINVVVEPSGGTSVTTVSIPCDFDPNGDHSVPGIEGGHGGGAGKGVLWEEVRLTQRTWINHRGVVGVHKIESEWQWPEDSVSGFFDMDLYNVLHFDAASFSHLKWFDAAFGTTGDLSDGTVLAPNFGAQERVYSMNSATTKGDDETGGASSIVSGVGGVGVGGPSGTDAAVMIIQDLRKDFLGETAKRLHDDQATGWKWSQKRDVASGRDGKGSVMVSAGRFLTGRFHPTFIPKTIAKGPLRTGFYMITDTWDNARVLASAILLP